MTETNTDQDSSMEDILASIRRIISDDENEPGAESAAAVDKEPPASGPKEASAPEGSDDSEVFDLTQMVNEDGSVVDIENGENPAPVEEQTSADDEIDELELRDIEEAADSPTVDVDEAMAPQGPEPEPEPELSPVEEVSPQADEGLVSDPAASSATAPLSTLIQAVEAGPGGQPIGDGDKTLEQLTKELMRPMIREWLDANLPTMVERLVAREISRISRRAEDS